MGACLSPQWFVADRSRVVVLLGFSVTCFGVSFGGVSPCVCAVCFLFGLGC